jgi:hypothetical protein
MFLLVDCDYNMMTQYERVLCFATNELAEQWFIAVGNETDPLQKFRTIPAEVLGWFPDVEKGTVDKDGKVFADFRVYTHKTPDGAFHFKESVVSSHLEPANGELVTVSIQ